MPVRPKSSGPSTFRHLHPASVWTPSGTTSARQTTDSSSRVRVTDAGSPVHAHEGTGSPAPSRQMARTSGSSDRFRGSDTVDDGNRVGLRDAHQSSCEVYTLSHAVC